jgi:manganese/iron transport system permease protein/iron/zinc/copper transport system permease protein
MIDWLTELQLNYGHVIKPLIVGTLVSIVCSVIGCFIVLRRMSFLADAIAHSMLAGVIGGYLLMKILTGNEAKLGALLVGAILAGIVTVGMVGFVTKVSRLKEDTAIGIMYTGIFALGALVISIKAVGNLVHIDIYHYVIGNVVSVSDADLWLLAGVTAIVSSVVILFYRQLQLTSFDPIMAASIGIPVLAMDYLLTACASLVVVSGVQIAGVILVIGLVITPAATAYLLTDRLDRMIVVAALIGIVGFWLGFLVATLLGADPGPAVIVTMTAMFLLTLVFAPRYGILADWFRRSNTVPQEVMEDVLGAMLREPGEKISIAQIERRVDTPNVRIRRAIGKLARQDLIDLDNGHAALTEKGRKEAVRLVRAHRLWEAYLEKIDLVDADIHEKAHQLEHISDQKTIEYLDDKLGHPLTDPHGTSIPEDVYQLDGDSDVRLSFLRRGHRAEVRGVLSEATGLGLEAGHVIVMGPRSDDGLTWTVITEDGDVLQLDHHQADALIVRLLSKVEP